MTETPTPVPADPRAKELLIQALRAGMAGQWQKAADITMQINDERGFDGVMTAIQGWCDALAQHAKIPRGKDIQLIRWEIETGQIDGPARPSTMWAMRVIQARLQWDFHEFSAAIDELIAISNDRLRGDYIMDVLRVAVLSIKHYRKGANA